MKITFENGKDIFIQSDWDFPGIASTFGWAPCHSVEDSDYFGEEI